MNKASSQRSIQSAHPMPIDAAHTNEVVAMSNARHMQYTQAAGSIYSVADALTDLDKEEYCCNTATD
jgi:hypothetical protein